MYSLDFSQKFNRGYKKLKKSGEKKSVQKVEDFLLEIMETPRKGTGKPEQLKGFGEREIWSRRISAKHRLVYEIKEEEIVILLLSAYGHYNDK